MMTFRRAALSGILVALMALACNGGPDDGAQPPVGGNPPVEPPPVEPPPVEPPPADVAVSVWPPTVTLAPLAKRTFTADVTGAADRSVTWAVQEGDAGGTVTGDGTYTAPATAGSYHVVVTSVADPAETSVALITVAGSPEDLCAGLVQDKLAHPKPASLSKPAPRQSYVDPTFGTTVRRISDAAARGATVVKPVYSTIQAFNADESYLLLYHTGGTGTGHHLYDGRTYAYLKKLSISPPDLEQVYWSTTDPKILHYVSSSTRRLIAYDVDTGVATTVHDFTTAPTSCGASLSGGGDPMWTSWTPQVFGLNCGGSKLFNFDKDTGAVGAVLSASSGLAPQPGPSGNLFFLSASGKAQVYDFDMNLLRTIPNISSSEHGVLGSADGADHFFSVQFGSNGSPPGNLIASNLETGATRVIVGQATGYPYPGTGTHISGAAYRKPGWVSVTVTGNPAGQTVLHQEVLLANTNSGGTVCRVAHHRSCGTRTEICGTKGYWAEPHGSISPSGTRILFASDWGGESVVETYVVELPGYDPSP